VVVIRRVDTLRVKVECWRSVGFLSKKVGDEPHGDGGGRC
ncbi:hypothetical protein A2U01_0075324, partial [Trifolium medium]|nr:hypothetical protein [Trifolium medium]